MQLLEQQQHILDQFPHRFKSLVLATTSEATLTPLLSYAPMMMKEGRFIILISRMAPHTHNLHTSFSGSALLVEDESQAKSIFFRQRLSFTFAAAPIGITPEWIDIFTQKHGEMVAMLTKMDFEFWQLTPLAGTFVSGPGQAFTIDSKLKIVQQNGRPGGHQK